MVDMRYKVALITVTSAALLAASSHAQAEPFVHRDLTLPGGVWAIDLGLGVGHVDRPAPVEDITGLGFNLEVKGGLTPRLQLGLRTGIRVGIDGRTTQADRYGRTFETETYDTGAGHRRQPGALAAVRGRAHGGRRAGARGTALCAHRRWNQDRNHDRAPDALPPGRARAARERRLCLRAWRFFPNVKGSGAADYFGFGVGLELRM